MTTLQKRPGGFTLIELLLVIAVIGMLAGLLAPALQSSRERARQTACKNNLHQLSVGLIMYKDDFKDMPNWLSDLYPKYIGRGSEDVYVCKSDLNRGKDEYACKPSELLDLTTDERNYNKVSDNKNDTSLNRTNNIYACSYMYEFSGAPCDAWTWSGFVNNTSNLSSSATWKEVKKCQLAYGDDWNGNVPYSESLFPVIRCYHHWKARTVDAVDPKTGQTLPKEGLTLNVSYAGNVYEGPLTWEHTSVK